MRAIVFDAFGGPERLRVAEIHKPSPASGEVLIEVHCASVNPVDWKIREGMLAELFPYEFPIVPGWDAAGVVAGAGSGVTAFRAGDKVFAYCRKPKIRHGTYAEYVTMAADAVAPMPGNMDFAAASTIPLTGLTAWQSLFDAGKLSAGQRVLIHAGAGGVGSLAIQFAKNAGATVYTTARGRNHAYVKGLGADAAIDYTREKFVDAMRVLAPEGVDLVLDTIGGRVQTESYKALRAGGMLVSIINLPESGEAERYGARTNFVFVSPNGGQLREIAALIEAGKVRPAEYEEIPLDRAAEAQERSRTGHVRGKIVLIIR
ncbi:MAG: NADP-dependent oxidoreductase [Candidatus Deferrimicrobiaceae bacterium]